MYIKISFVIFISWLLVAVSYAQEKPMGSRLVDESGVGVGYAAIIALSVADSSIVASTMSDEQGWFNLSVDSLYDSELLYEFSCPRYVKTSFVGGVLPPQIVMESALIVGDNITEVTVMGKKTSFSRQGDRYVFRISPDLEIVRSSNVYDILKMTPLVLVNESGGISIAGKGSPQIYINGRKSRLQSQALMSYLKSIPASSLSTIEVIPIAGSTYAGDGNFSVIEINLKKRLNDGFSGTASVSSTQAHANSQQASLNLDIRKSQVAINTSIWASNSNTKSSESQNTTFANSYKTISQTLAYARGQNYGANIKMDYDITDKQVFGVIIGGNYGNRTSRSNNLSQYAEGECNHPDSIYNTKIENNGFEYNLYANLNYQIKSDDKGSGLSLDLDYMNYLNMGRQSTMFNRLNPDLSIDYSLGELLQRNPQKISSWSGRVQYSHVFGRPGTLTTGLQAHSTTSDDDTYYAIGQWDNVDLTRSNHFVFNEIISTFFASYSVQVAPKFSATLGGRIEYTYNKGNQLTSTESFLNYKLRLMPTIFLSYDISENSSLSYSFSNRIKHPTYSSLNPFRTYTSPTSYSEGNPLLKASKYFSSDLAYVYKGKLMAGLSASSEANKPMLVKMPNQDNGTKEVIVNYGSETQYNLNIGMYGSYFNDIWQANNTAAAVYVQGKGLVDGENLDYSTIIFVMNLYNSVTISKKHSIFASIGINFMSGFKSAIGHRPPNYTVDTNLTKRFNNLAMTLYANDIFRTGSYLLTRQSFGLVSSDWAYGGSQCLGLSLSYSFGNNNIKGTRNRTTSNNDVKGRL